MKILVTGAAGFIGLHLTNLLLARGDTVFGIDNLNDYYDVTLKENRLKQLKEQANFSFQKMDIADLQSMEQLFEQNTFDCVVNLAAQAGVRYSLENPHAYISANIDGFLNVLECCRHHTIKNLVFASSSSVYGANKRYPFVESSNVDHPVALYAATKKANELMAHSYASLYGIPCTGLRFFTVYGPWGRPDMALFSFTKSIIEGKTIEVFNHGDMARDFTYVDDIVKGIACVIDNPAKANANWDAKQPDPASSYAPYRIYNIGNGNPVKLMDFISAIEKSLGIEAKKNMLPMQAGDVAETYADTSQLGKDFGFQPGTDIQTGVDRFVAWYKTYFKT